MFLNVSVHSLTDVSAHGWLRLIGTTSSAAQLFEGACSMAISKRFSSIAASAIIWIGSVNATSSAGEIVAGSFQGVATIQVQQVVVGEPVGIVVTYSDVPATIGFSFANNGRDYFEFDSNVLSFIAPINYQFAPPPIPGYKDTYIDGIPGQSADQFGIVFSSFFYHSFNLNAGLSLIDPSGEFLGPNGNGDPSHVQTMSTIYYDSTSPMENGENTVVNFTTVAEPSSVVLAMSAAALALAVALARTRRTTARTRIACAVWRRGARQDLNLYSIGRTASKLTLIVNCLGALRLRSTFGGNAASAAIGAANI
jgi:hypothetical protein